MTIHLWILVSIAAAMLIGGIWGGYSRDTTIPVITLIYMATTGLGYLIGFGFRIFKEIFLS